MGPFRKCICPECVIWQLKNAHRCYGVYSLTCSLIESNSMQTIHYNCNKSIHNGVKPMIIAFAQMLSLACLDCHFGTFFEQPKWSCQLCFSSKEAPKQVERTSEIGDRTDGRTNGDRTNTHRFFGDSYTICPSGKYECQTLFQLGEPTISSFCQRRGPWSVV